MNLGLGLGLTHQRPGGGGSPSLSAQVEAMLAGTTGFALDPSDLTTMWQDSAKTTPVTAGGQTVGALRTKWGAAQFDFIQASGPACPLFDGTRYLTFDGIDDRLQTGGAVPVLKNASGYYLAVRQSGIASSIMNSARMTVQGSLGRLRAIVKRLDADGTTSWTGVNNTIMGGATVAFALDLAVDGAAAIYRENVFIETVGPLAGPFANSSNTDLTLITLLNNGGGAYSAGSIGRMVVLPFVPSADQRATIQDWLMEV